MLIGEFEAHAAVHRGQRRLRGPDIRVVGRNTLAASGQQPDGPASWTDDRGIVGHSDVGPAGDLLDSGRRVQADRALGDHRDDFRLIRRYDIAATMCHNGFGEPLRQRPRESPPIAIAARPARRGRQRRLLPILDGDGEGRSRVRGVVGCRVAVQPIGESPASAHSGTREVPVGYFQGSHRPRGSRDRRSRRRRYSPTAHR